MKKSHCLTIWLTVLVAVPLPSVSLAQQCLGDGNGDEQVTIDELVTAVGNALTGCGTGEGLARISGTLVAGQGERFRIWATSESGEIFATDSDADTGHFQLLVPPGEWYVVGVGHFHGTGEMHFSGHMVFACDASVDDHFFVGDTHHPIDLGMMVPNEDGSFVHPGRGPLDQLDSDGDGIVDEEDPDHDCEAVGDRNGDGFYDDDLDHDGYHDDDQNHDGHPEVDHHGGHHGGPMHGSMH